MGHQVCMRCSKPLTIWFNVMLCDECCDKQVKIAKLENAHKALGENTADGALSVEELEEIWKR